MDRAADFSLCERFKVYYPKFSYGLFIGLRNQICEFVFSCFREREREERDFCAVTVLGIKLGVGVKDGSL